MSAIEKDSWLKNMKTALDRRARNFQTELSNINKLGGIIEYSNAYTYYGFNYDKLLCGWWFREWLPKAEDVFLMGDFNDWSFSSLHLTKDETGVWSIFLPDTEYKDRIVNGTKYKLYIHGNNGSLQRASAYTQFMTYDSDNKSFTPTLYISSFDWQNDTRHIRNISSPLIYELHIGMSSEKQGITSYIEARDIILPRIVKLGYNTIQIMALAEHPYYGSFGYHVSNLYAPSSWFGTPDELKSLIKEAHALGLNVIMDLIHSHYVKNTNEGIAHLDGSDDCYSPQGQAAYHKQWDSYTYDYSKNEVRRYLLSNIKYWLEEYHIDGFRFDGVTSILYHNHGFMEFHLGVNDYDSTNVNEEAITYLTLANHLIKTLNKNYITIAEEVSGMPALTISTMEDGIGFNYRLAMYIADYWANTAAEKNWNMNEMWHVLNDRLPYVPTISYVESHDQSIQGDKTVAFRLMDKTMYSDMNKATNSPIIERGIALHKMIRMITLATAGDGYMTFIGNEFGHPEWVDFPSASNNWSFEKARRQWNLADNKELRYNLLLDFEKEMIQLTKNYNLLDGKYAYLLKLDTENKIMIFKRSNLIFIFNWHPYRSFENYTFEVEQKESYKVIMSSNQEYRNQYVTTNKKGCYQLTISSFSNSFCVIK